MLNQLSAKVQQIKFLSDDVKNIAVQALTEFKELILKNKMNYEWLKKTIWKQNQIQKLEKPNKTQCRNAALNKKQL